MIWLCAMGGTTIGGFVPALWGGSSLGASSLLFSLFGGIAGIWVGIRLSGA